MSSFSSSSMSAEEIVKLSKPHTIFEWSAQSSVAPLTMAKAKGIYFWDTNGKRFADWNSQLMSVNIGHGDERVINAIKEQAERLPYRSEGEGHLLLGHQRQAVRGLEQPAHVREHRPRRRARDQRDQRAGGAPPLPIGRRRASTSGTPTASGSRTGTASSCP